MLKSLYPKLYVDSIFEIRFEDFLQKKIKGLIFDIDNTLVPFDIEKPTEKIVSLFAKLKEMGFRICLLSNNSEKRVLLFNEEIKLFSVHKARKPGLKGINKALSLLETNPDNTVLVGDQIFTDVWCGNKKKLYTVLVKPVAARDEFTVKLKRGLEKIVVDTYVRSCKRKHDKR